MFPMNSELINAGNFRGWNSGPWGLEGWKEPKERLWVLSTRPVLISLEGSILQETPCQTIFWTRRRAKSFPWEESHSYEGKAKPVISTLPSSMSIPVESTAVIFNLWATRIFKNAILDYLVRSTILFALRLSY